MNIKQSICAIMLGSVANVYAETPALVERKIKVTPIYGHAPLSVTLTGPPELMEKVRVCKETFGSFGYTIDWGDNSASPSIAGDGRSEDCNSHLQHTYTVSGKFKITALVFHLGPTDEPITDWKGDTGIQVAASGERLRSSVELHTRTLVTNDGQGPMINRAEPIVHWGGGLPRIKFNILTNQPAELVVELISSNGKIIGKSQKRILSSGEDFVDVNDQAPDEMYANGQFKAYVKLSLMVDGKIISTDQTSPFIMSPVASYGSVEVTPSAGKAPLKVTASREFFHTECYSYIVRWGDGMTDKKISSCRKGANKEITQMALKHTYLKAGHYEIRWLDNSVESSKPVKDGPGYFMKEVTVK